MNYTSRSFLFALLFLSVLFTACGGGKKVVGSGALLDDKRALLPFTELVMNAPVNVVMTKGNTQSVNVRAQGQILPILITEVKGDKLTIKMMSEAQMDASTTIEIVSQELNSIEKSGSGSLTFTGYTGNKLKIDMDGSGSISGKSIEYDDTKIKVDGSGDVDLGGQCDKIEVELDSSGDVDLHDLSSKDAKVTNKGSGDIRVMVSDKIKAEIKGSGNILYQGEPKVELSDDGSGELKGNN